MANKYASMYNIEHSKYLQSVSLPDENNTVEGDKVVWDLDTAVTAARTLTVRKFDSSRAGEYDNVRKPAVMIKCHVDCSSYNVTVKDDDANTLYTFALNCATTPGFIVLHLTATGGWEVP